MTTTVVKSIGNGRDYPDLLSFLTAVPTNLVTADQAWIAELYNDGEFVWTVAQTTGLTYTTDATRNITIRCASGQGVRSTSLRASAAARYNAALGVAVRTNLNYSNFIEIKAAYTTIDGLQIHGTQTDSPQSMLYLEGANCTIRGCLIEVDKLGSAPAVSLPSANTLFESNLVIARTAASAIPPVDLGWEADSAVARFNTVAVLANSGSAPGMKINGGAPLLRDNLFINCAAITTSVASGSSNNATTASTIVGASGLANLTAAVESVATDGTHNLRPKAGAAILGAGTPISGITTDILGNTRSGTTPTIGAVETVATAAPVTAGGGTISGPATLSGGGGSAANPGSATGGGGTLAASAALVGGGGSAALGGSLQSDVLVNNTGTVLASLSVWWTWYSGAIGAAPTAALVHGAAVTDLTGKFTAAGLPAGVGFLLVRDSTGVSVAYQPATI